MRRLVVIAVAFLALGGCANTRVNGPSAGHTGVTITWWESPPTNTGTKP